MLLISKSISIPQKLQLLHRRKRDTGDCLQQLDLFFQSDLPVAHQVVLPSMEVAMELTWATVQAGQHKQVAMGQQLTTMVAPHLEVEDRHQQTDMDHHLL